ncbi:MAG: hypothetical protein AB4426_20180 [Xenococcaceae cyanobacterium]
MQTKAKATRLGGTDPKAKTRLLLNLWNLGGVGAAVNKSELTKQVKLNKEKSGDYQRVYEELEKDGAITVTTKGRSVKVSLTEKGWQMLDAGLKSHDFQYRPQQRVRTKDFNALLNWIKHIDGAVTVPNGKNKTNEKAVSVQDVSLAMPKAIASYEEFKSVVLDVYDRLNRDYNLDHLVPIYRIRREIGECVTRSQFNEWMLEMQANDIFQFQGGEMPDITPDKAEDSIITQLSGLRYYAQRLS